MHEIFNFKVYILALVTCSEGLQGWNDYCTTWWRSSIHPKNKMLIAKSHPFCLYMVCYFKFCRPDCVACAFPIVSAKWPGTTGTLLIRAGLWAELTQPLFQFFWKWGRYVRDMFLIYFWIYYFIYPMKKSLLLQADQRILAASSLVSGSWPRCEGARGKIELH